MSIIKVGKIAGREITKDKNGDITAATEQWLVLTTLGETLSAVADAPGLPTTGEAHPDVSGLFVSEITPKEESNGQKWIVDIKYSPNNPSSESEDLIKITYGTHEIQKDVVNNLGTGKPILDSNGHPFEDTIQVPYCYPYIKIVKKQKTMSRSDVIEKSGTINDAEVTVAGVAVEAHCGKIKIEAVEQNDDTKWKWEISYEVWIRYHLLSNFIDFDQQLEAGPTQVGWDEGILNAGLFYYEPSNTGPNRQHTRALEDICDEEGNVVEQRPTARPILLAADGQKLAEGQTPILIRVQTLPTEDWSGLGLNNV